MQDELNGLILKPQHVTKLRYSAHARMYETLQHCTESLKRDDIESFYLQMADEHNCRILTSYLLSSYLHRPLRHNVTNETLLLKKADLCRVSGSSSLLVEYCT